MIRLFTTTALFLGLASGLALGDDLTPQFKAQIEADKNARVDALIGAECQKFESDLDLHGECMRQMKALYVQGVLDGTIPRYDVDAPTPRACCQ